MKIPPAAVAAATLALSACSSSEPAKEVTVTKTAAVDPADAKSATEDDEADADAAVQAEKEAETGTDLWADIDTYADAYSLAMAVGDDFWAKGDSAFECRKAEQSTAQERDEYSGDIADVTYLECSRKGTMELVNMTVVDDYTEEGPAVPVCDEFLEGDTCFTGKGWTVDAANTHLLKEVLDELDVDHEAWGVGEELVPDGH